MILKKIIPLILIIVFSLFTIRSFFSDGFFPMHDDAQVARVIVMTQALKNGQFPVRLVSDLGYGYGYPLFNFYGPLPYYVGGALHALGVDALTATKMMIGIGVIVGSLSVYLLTSSIVGSFAGLFSSMLFTYFPYRAVQIYVRGAVGELWAISLLPFVLYGLIKLFRKETVMKGILVGSISLSGVILSHTVFGYISAGLIIGTALTLYGISLFTKKNSLRQSIIPLLGMLAIALGLTAFFWLPAVSEMKYTNVSKVIGETANYKDHYICFSQLWDSPWGFGGSAPGCLDGMSFKLGKLHVIFFLAAVSMLIFAKEKIKCIHGVLIGLVFLTGLLLFAMLSISELIWKIIPFSSFVQYPWRLLGLIGICMSVVSGYLFYKRQTIAAIIMLVFLGGGVMLQNGKLFEPHYLYYRPLSSFSSKEELQLRASSVSDEYLPKGIKIPFTIQEVVENRVQGNETVNVVKLKESETYGSYEIEADSNQELKLNMAFFPGWKFYINGNSAPSSIVDGQPYVVLSAGNTLLEMRFSNTPVRMIGNGISLLTILGIFGFYMYEKKTYRHHRHTCL